MELNGEEQLRPAEVQPEEEEREVEEEQEMQHLSASQWVPPQSYRSNSLEEANLLSLARRFQLQFLHVFPQRKPLLLCPLNECGVQKFVSTTIRASPPSVPQLLTWEDCTSFVTDFLTLRLLDPPEELPTSLHSPSWVLRSQSASCFEFSVVLCSLLLGAGYDAYCVSGYATKGRCEGEEVEEEEQEEQEKPIQVVTSPQKHQDNRYSLKPERALQSHYLRQQEKLKEEVKPLQGCYIRQGNIQRVDAPPADVLQGLRVYSWVLVLSGCGGVTENFFIDPAAGKKFSTNSSCFLGIESVWNPFNCYINMQDCTEGCRNLVFDLDDLNFWEPVLFGAPSRKQLMTEKQMGKNVKTEKEEEEEEREKQKEEEEEEGEEEEEEEQHRVCSMPRSWVSLINITETDLENRWPGGQKVTHFRNTKLEKFSPRVRPDGLMTRQTSYTDRNFCEVCVVKEWYQYRNDGLQQREINMLDRCTSETFRPGQLFNLLSLRWKSVPGGLEVEVVFEPVRIDDLVLRVLTPHYMSETFEGRTDLLHQREVFFKTQVSVPEGNGDTNIELQERSVERVVERFHRNFCKSADEDVAERVFLVSERRIELTFHTHLDRIIPSILNFTKPPQTQEKHKGQSFNQATVSSFQVDETKAPRQTWTLHKMLESLMKDEEQLMEEISQAQKETAKLFSCRKEEEKHLKLDTTTPAEQALRSRRNLERKAAEEKERLQELENDFLAPLLLRLELSVPLSPDQAQQVHQLFIVQFKDKLVQQAQLLQERYQEETQELQERQAWFQKNQLTLNKQQDEEYKNYCSQKTLQIRATQRRLRMHRETVQERVNTVDQKLRLDPRLSAHLNP